MTEYVMTFEDFCAFYLVFTQKKDEEMSQLVFEMMQLNPNHISHKPLED